MMFKRDRSELKKDFKQLLFDLIDNIDSKNESDKKKIVSKLRELEELHESLNKEEQSGWEKLYKNVKNRLSSILGGRSN